jgi:hypothetical protein
MASKYNDIVNNYHEHYEFLDKNLNISSGYPYYSVRRSEADHIKRTRVE